MDTNNISKTNRVIELLEALASLEGQKAVLLSGPYTPDYAAKAAQDKLFEIAEVSAEIVQIVKDLEGEVSKTKKYARMWQRVANA